MDRQQQLDAKIAQIQAELAPKFKYVEQFRQQFFKDTSIHAVLIAIVLIALFMAGVDWMLMIGLSTLGLFYLRIRQSQYVQKVKVEAVKPMAEILELNYIPTGSRDILNQARDAQLLPHFTNAKTEDGFIGTANGTEFEFTEAHLKVVSGSGKDRKERPVFDGGIMRFKLPYRVAEDLLILSDAGIFNSLKNASKSFSGMENVRLEDVRFEGIYQVYGRDQVEARRVLTPLFMDVLSNLKERFDAKIANKTALTALKKSTCKIQMLFSGNTLILVLNYKGDYFEPGLMFNKLDNDWITDMVEDFALMRFVASSLKLQDHNYAHTQVSE